MSTEYTAGRTAARTGAILTLFAALFTAAMAFTYSLTKPDIAAAIAETKHKLIAEILPPDAYDNALLDDALHVPATDALGLPDGGMVYRARKGGEPVALLVEASAPNGYGGAIGLILAVRTDGSLSGVRVTDHKETPGLGDYVDRKKDHDKAHPWIDQFENASFARIPKDAWAVKKDGGAFDFHTGATVSPRAVTAAVARALAWTIDNEKALFAAPAGATFAAGHAQGDAR
ncbi:electron transport complex subunit RsxG [Nitrogeniibacter mangrovi]|uniref:Ion-translocating oxidoreductase complex subunit G n=1 Tax=Nitrogeniibacter mangrovi TaxID=2016596 RepID=A0A6C1B3B9_9RHOO|nr:electron transport complex subunit RsxG [Nitrogeniibacter mangrovi]QID18136.1 electron transport complex subunit RsxG [Nitrogeniibacter mangrovi]